MELLNFLTGPRLNSPSKHTHADTEEEEERVQIIVFSHWKKDIHIPQGHGATESLCFFSHGHSSIPPQTMTASPAPPSEPLSFLCHQFTLSYRGLIQYPLEQSPVLGWKSFTGSCCTASTIVNSRLELGLGVRLCVIAAIRFRMWRGLLHRDRSVSEAGWRAAPAASCLCDLTVCVNQQRVSARPASLISISLQITPRRQSEGAEL